jgi:hypothetical protein
MNQFPFEYVFVLTKVGSPHPARIVTMRKGAFHQFASFLQEAFTIIPVDSSAVGVNCLLLRLLAAPVPPARLLAFRDVSANLNFLRLGQHCAAVVSLVRNHFLNAGHVYLRLFGGGRFGFALDQIGDRSPA